jgi:YfiH family protein
VAAELAVIVPDWPAPGRVRAVATTRAGGVSQGPYDSLNLGDHVGDDAAAVAENRRRIVARLGLPESPRWLRQVHGATVARAEDWNPPASADAMLAEGPGRVCGVLTADCLPLLFCDVSGRHIAVAHAGWRGLAAGIVEATIAALAEAGVAAGDLLAWLGPAISGPAYEVGDEVRAAFLARDPQAAGDFTANPRCRWQLDLPAVARRRLLAGGVHRIFGGSYCTHRNRTRFFSYRRDGVCGRQATLIWLDN